MANILEIEFSGKSRIDQGSGPCVGHRTKYTYYKRLKGKLVMKVNGLDEGTQVDLKT